jgi:hypothetical protein
LLCNIKLMILFVCFNATFSNISAISWRQHQVNKIQQCYYYDIYILVSCDYNRDVGDDLWERTCSTLIQSISHSLSRLVVPAKLHHTSVNAWKIVPKSHDHHYRFQSHDQNIVVLVDHSSQLRLIPYLHHTSSVLR